MRFYNTYFLEKLVICNIAPYNLVPYRAPFLMELISYIA